MRKPRIEAKPKRVELVLLADGSFPVRAGIDIRPFLNNIDEIRCCIVAGRPLPEKYYRRSLGEDFLLKETGWLHLHVGYGIDDNVLLIVEQTADMVIFIGLTTHSIFTERPRARSLRGLGTRIARAKLARNPSQA